MPDYDKKALTNFLEEKATEFKKNLKEGDRVSFYIYQLTNGTAMLCNVSGLEKALKAAYSSQISSGLLTKMPKPEEITGITEGINKLLTEVKEKFGVEVINPMNNALSQKK
jgi:hypothetical protein